MVNPLQTPAELSTVVMISYPLAINPLLTTKCSCGVLVDVWVAWGGYGRSADAFSAAGGPQ